LLYSPLPGLGLIQVLLSKYSTEDVAIFATARDPSKADALNSLQRKHPDKVFVLPYDAEDRQSAKKATREVEQKFGWVDVVIGNAGVFLTIMSLCIVLALLTREFGRCCWYRKASRGAN
jgi:NADP-dependent 3-hydroxy acid dehydrogenase YdfG